MEKTYRLNGNSITCLMCGATSYHPEDIRNRYCGRCHVFHEIEHTRRAMYRNPYGVASNKNSE